VRERKGIKANLFLILIDRSETNALDKFPQRGKNKVKRLCRLFRIEAKFTNGFVSQLWNEQRKMNIFVPKLWNNRRTANVFVPQLWKEQKK
jgi:hypothetical protein